METTSVNTRQIGANLGDRVPEDLLHHLLGQAYELDFGHTDQFSVNDLGIGLRVLGPPLLADDELDQ